MMVIMDFFGAFVGLGADIATLDSDYTIITEVEMDSKIRKKLRYFISI